ncbi:RNA polymerase sigma factor [Natronincola ferrireducens]|uniref:RNA polymerase sporulation-specific sigma factor n=1 Tax=Natronincola ferrireducens TaxID=393762 RepID=A0A1G8XL56_9FIRM|nr:sigma-70 family RNA polymerase sigma factor [Natronincola ferrireducens]SDJ90635.1 RNA polymerase sporulation-specific sigma factor [Natronincola ferrireducens]
MNRLFEELVKKALKGEKEAIEQLLLQLRPLIIAYSKRYGGREGMDEDAYQEGLLEILEGLQDFDSAKNVPFLAYITIRVRYYYLNKRRKVKSHFSLEADIGDSEGISLIDLLEDTTAKVEETYMEMEESQRLKEAIHRLTSCQRDIILQYYFHRKTLKEIAAIKGIHPISVAKTKATGLKKLKKLLKEWY